jgi:hypothetical protein
VPLASPPLMNRESANSGMGEGASKYCWARCEQRDFLDFVGRSNRDTPEGAVEIPYEYLLVVARKRG